MADAKVVDSVTLEKLTRVYLKIKVKQKYWTSDWESMHKFILEHEVPEFLEKRLHQGAVKGFLEENPELLPKGLNVDSEYAVTVRKA